MIRDIISNREFFKNLHHLYKKRPIIQTIRYIRRVKDNKEYEYRDEMKVLKLVSMDCFEVDTNEARAECQRAIDRLREKTAGIDVALSIHIAFDKLHEFYVYNPNEDTWSCDGIKEPFTSCHFYTQLVDGSSNILAI